MEESSTRGEQTRNRLVEAARQLFVESGYNGTSMRQIAERAGLALGGIYNHFDSKEAIFVAVMREHNPYVDIIPALNAAQGDTAEALLRDAAAQLLAAMGSRPDGLRLLFVEIVEFDGQHFAQLFDELFPQLAQFAQRFAQAGDALRPIPLPTLLRAFVGFFFAYFMTEWLMGDQFAALTSQSALDDFVDIYLHGVLQR